MDWLACNSDGFDWEYFGRIVIAVQVIIILTLVIAWMIIKILKKE